MSIEIVSFITNRKWVRDVLDAGADAVYCGLKNCSWHNTEVELTWDELVEVGKLVHEAGKKLYLAINRDLSNGDVDEILARIKLFEDCAFDGVILSDWGCIEAIRKLSMKVNIHLSANTGCVNDWDFKLAKELRVQRIVLSQSFEFEWIQNVVKRYQGFEWEVITYGNRCFNEVAYCPCNLRSGDAIFDNICFHQFTLYENDRPLSAEKDFCRIISNGDLAKRYYELGINHWKLEGRSKGLQYIVKGTKTLKDTANSIER